MSVLVEFSVVPLDKGASVSSEVARAVKIVAESGISYRINPMGTVLEGEWDEVMDVVKRCHHAVRNNSERVITSIKIDDRRGTEQRIDRKVGAVEQRLGTKLRT